MTERPIHSTHINAAVNADGSRNVSFYDRLKGWFPAGRLMPELRDTRQQPRSLAYKLLSARTAVDFIVDSHGVCRDVRS